MFSCMAFLLVGILPCLCQSSLHTKFSHFEILSPRHIAVRVKRDVNGQEKHKTLTLSIFGRKVYLILKAGLPESLMSPDVKIYEIGAKGTKLRIVLDLNDFYQGAIQGHSDSRVNSFYHEGLWTIQVVHPTMSFSVEPLSFHVEFEKKQMVAYRLRDVRILNRTEKQSCNHFLHENTSSSFSTIPILNKEVEKRDLNLSEDATISQILQNEINDPVLNTRYKLNFNPRIRRDLKSSESCDILAVADYTFYNGFGAKSTERTAKLLTNIYSLAFYIFSKTEFEAKKKISIQIRDMHIHTDKEYPFGFLKVNVGNETYLRLSSKESYFKEYCLVHLTTQRQFKDDTLSSGFTARLIKEAYGICGTHPHFSGNVGFSTVSYKNVILPLTSYRLLVSHELGHNFGASHDGVKKTSQSQCLPSNDAGGKFLMWHNLVTGIEPNNYKFSPCSIRSINKILKLRSKCLTSSDVLDHDQCGNGILDHGEDCDAGKNANNDTCCTPTCRLIPRAVCSSFNHPCCINCTLAPKSHPCKHKIEHSCFEDSFCDGIHFYSCPPSKTKPDGHKCANQGECQNGTCINYCSLLGQRKKPLERLESCNCESNRRSMCSICCRNALSNQTCFDTGKNYDNGLPCNIGFCENGICGRTGPLDTADWSDFLLESKWKAAQSIDYKLYIDFYKHIMILIFACSFLLFLTCTIFFFRQRSIKKILSEPYLMRRLKSLADNSPDV